MENNKTTFKDNERFESQEMKFLLRGEIVQIDSYSMTLYMVSANGRPSWFINKDTFIKESRSIKLLTKLERIIYDV